MLEFVLDLGWVEVADAGVGAALGVQEIFETVGAEEDHADGLGADARG